MATNPFESSDATQGNIDQDADADWEPTPHRDLAAEQAFHTATTNTATKRIS